MSRHIKKYYFYLIARCLCLFGFYDRALPYYSKVIQIRTFFFNAQKHYMRAYEKSTQTSNLEVHGGVGDFLQHLPFMLQHPKENYMVFTHFPKAKEFFSALNIHIKEIHFYKDGKHHQLLKSRLRTHINSFLCPREIFFKNNPFNLNTTFHFDKKPVIGLQMSTSNQTGGHLNKKFVLKLINTLVGQKMTVVLFGTDRELEVLNLKKSQYLFFGSHPNIIKNLALVRNCDLLIGAESVFKTMSSMSKIPTLVYHKDNNNRFRDRVFINPYIEAGVMSVYKYQNLEREIDDAINFALNMIRKLKLND